MSRIGARILTRMTLVVALVAGMVLAVSTSIYDARLASQAVNNVKALDDQVMYQVDAIFRLAATLPRYIEIDTEIAGLMERLKAGPGPELEASYRARMELRLNSFVSQNEIQSVAIVTDDGGRFAPAYPKGIDLDAQLKSEWYRDYKRNKYQFFFSNPYQVTGYRDLPMMVFTYVVPYVNIAGSSGDILVTVNFDGLRLILKAFSSSVDDYLWFDSTNSAFYLFPPSKTSDRARISSIAPQLASNSLYNHVEFQDAKGYYFIRKSEVSGWKLVTYVSRHTLFLSYADSARILLAAVLGGFICLLLALGPLLSYIVKPIQRLSLIMKDASSRNYEVRAEIHTRDEIEDLAESFNRMVEQIRIDSLKLVENERIEHRLKYSLMISQLDPHFLYNTLNTITYLARKGRTDDIVIVNAALITILQDVLRISDVELCDSVEREVSVTKQYLVIQGYRYGDSFGVDWDIDEGLLAEQIPKNLIQPLVENALFHGFSLSEEGADNRISISVRQEGDRIVIRVVDNGVGMDSGTLAALRGEGASEEGCDGSSGEPVDRGRNIGLSGLRRRLRHYYGDDDRLLVESDMGKGASVTIRLDRRREKSP
jgi:Predicted signal transduction protein with a C-terminal ATPase domain